jgi:hypothetical protein
LKKAIAKKGKLAKEKGEKEKEELLKSIPILKYEKRATGARI